MVLVISTSSVSATHTPTVSIDKTLLPFNKDIVLTVTIANQGPDAIDNVRIVLPTGFTGEVLSSVPAGTNAELAAVDNENVIIPAGTMVKIVSGKITIPANTEVIRLAGDNIEVENATSLKNRVLLENVRIKKAAAVETENLVSENLEMHADTKLALQENDVVTLTETIVVRKTGGIYTLVEDTMVKVHDDVDVKGAAGGENLIVKKDTAVTVDNGSNWVTQHSVSTKVGIDTYTLVAGAYVTLDYPENNVVLPAGTVVQLKMGTTLLLYENTEVKRNANENIYVATTVENKPNGWTQSVSGTTLEWTGIGDNKIPSGGSLEFPILAHTPSTSDTYTIYVRTKDKAGVLKISEIQVTVDATAPTVTTEVTPKYVKGQTQVTIKVTASEALAKLDNVMVCENKGENVQITMTPSADKKTWTGTYTTSDNLSRDGRADVYVIGADYEDLAGNKGSNATDNFTVDRRAPPAPDLSALTAWITENAARTPAPGIQTNKSTWTIEGTAKDNFLNVVSAQEGMTVKIRVGTQVFTVSADQSGYFYKTITLSEGKQEVGIKYIDRAGNEGPENVENVTLDTAAPVINITAPSSEYINDNTPFIKVLISDATLGIENTAFNTADNTGYTVQLRRDDNTVVGGNLVAASTIVAPFTSATFENQYPTELPDNLYHIYVVAGDNLQKAEKIFKFHVDTKAPDKPTSLAGTVAGGSATAPTATTAPSITLSGTAESKATIKVYTTTNAGVTWTEYTAGRTTAGSSWTTNVDLTGFAGKTLGIAVTATDLAGNEGDKAVYGYLIYTPAPPANLAGSLAAGATAGLAKATSTSTLNLAGTATANYTIKVYTTTDGGVTWTEYTAGKTTATTTGAWTTSVQLSGFAGKAVGIAVTATDTGGNESDRVLYGYLIYDANAPSVEITSPASGTTTDQTTVQVTGRVTKDAWESYSNIKLTLQVGVGSVEVPIGSDGTFVYSVALAEGMNTIVARATDGVNVGTPVNITVTRTVTPWSTYAIIIVIVALILAAIAIFRRR
ncbi:MAG: hypothetical protein ACUVQM_04115 [Candidatus Hadarchaeaceae archaeon]